MSIKTCHIENYIILPVLRDYGLHSDGAVNLLLGTAAQESLMGTYLRQEPVGPACGIFQMEAGTHNDIWHNFIMFKPFLVNKMKKEFGEFHDQLFNKLVHDLRYAALMCRLHYLRVPMPLPHEEDINGLAQYWKDHYNTVYGKGTVEDFKENYNRFVLT